MTSHAVKGLRCPVIVRSGCEAHHEEDGRPGIWHESENRCEVSFLGAEGYCYESWGRCGDRVLVALSISESGHGYGSVSCLSGHGVDAMAHDNALDLDGIPVGA